MHAHDAAGIGGPVGKEDKSAGILRLGWSNQNLIQHLTHEWHVAKQAGRREVPGKAGKQHQQLGLMACCRQVASVLACIDAWTTFSVVIVWTTAGRK